jgi:hypothetical protein
VPDRSLLNAVRPADGHGLYAAFVEVCNHGERIAQATDRILLEDAFGKSYAPIDRGLESSLTYDPVQLDSGECLPSDGSLAEDAFSGAAVVFEVPYEVTRNRPLVLQITGAGDNADRARVVLDL